LKQDFDQALTSNKLANLISHRKKDIFHSINNSWTGVLYACLLISGSEMANTKWEKLFMIWLAEHDQGHLGLGMVGIDFDDINWSTEEFQQQQYFIIEIARKAIADKSWIKLSYKPDEQILVKLLNVWIDIFSNAGIEDVKDKQEEFNWYMKPEISTINRKCSIHNIYLNRLGSTDTECCYLCNEK